METFRFLGFKVYIDARDYFQRVLIVSEKINSYSYKDQIRRAALSVILNIAEGSAKKSDLEFARYLEISLGSLNETVACIDVIKCLGKINNLEYNSLLSDASELAKQLGGFIKKLKVKG